MLTFVRIPLGVSSSRVARSCALCKGERVTARDLPDILLDIDNIAHLSAEQYDGVLFEGFEPFTHPNLVEILRQVCSISPVRIALHTDGGALSHVDNVQGSMDMGVRVFEVSVCGSNPILHDKIAGSSGLFKAMISGVGQIREVAQNAGYSVALIASLDICEHNKDDFLNMISFCLEKGFDAIRIRLGTQFLDYRFIEQAHTMATVQGVLLFGSHVPFVNGAQLYEVRDVGELE